MTDTALLLQKSSIWWVFLLQGFAGIILGLMLVTQPGATIAALTIFLGFYWLITGLLDWCSPLWIVQLPGFGRSSGASLGFWPGFCFETFAGC
jgi:uncharacterized membrane protein HdeD (DUF308 family)